MSILSKSIYEEVPYVSLQREIELAIKGQRSLARQIAGFHDEPSFERLINSALRQKQASVVSRLQITCKTHKPAGQVGFRGIHATPSYLLLGLSSWVAFILASFLKQSEYSHILRDTQQFVSEVSAVQAEDHHYMIKFDITDYFMSGTREDLAKDATSHITNQTLRSLVYDAIITLLYSQLVSTPEDVGRLWRVLHGSGMGLKHSGETMDIALANLCEVCWCTNPRIMEMHGIVKYWRYRDDGFVIASDRSMTYHYFKGMRERAKYFKVVIEGTNRKALKFLEVMVRKVNKQYICTPCFKETTLRNHPLCITSAHPWHTLVSWPVAQLRRLGSISTSIKEANQAKEVFIARFVEHLAPTELISLLKRTKPQMPKATKEPVQTNQEGPVSLVFWFPVGFHPAIQRFLGSALHKFNSDQSYQCLISSSFNLNTEVKVKIAWKKRAEVSERYYC